MKIYKKDVITYLSVLVKPILNSWECTLVIYCSFKNKYLNYGINLMLDALGTDV